ncbi:hypothetical protein [Mesorhizobium sp. M8A.F.Ca.ET.165.01.1.1]|uniref:hypothetical protein n=1 Tax=Mesorhizobium sp. M8A.F.Ca.ET.165.01.1.1 TaxID=2563960 RepID=UPI00109355CE|nr:hypothetical protein [Mesorhizobium sp. M8A.F.Ca.ET.165.01.1.1]TGT42796.1 hypothetical protein EN808_13010 [Mesorhizobium sp. M8A.F.Ca.ET.165.01.1.1]
MFAYATARRSGLVGRDNHVGKAQLLALPARMAVQWRRFQPLRVADPRFCIAAVGKRTYLAIDSSEMSPEGLDEVYQTEVKSWRPSPDQTPPATWVDHPAMIYPQVVIYEHLARQLRLPLPTWSELPTPIQTSAPVILPPDNQYWAITLRARTRFEPPAGMLLARQQTVAE